jgi:hypothetical protein
MVEIDRGIPYAREMQTPRAQDNTVVEAEAGSVAEAVGGAAAVVLAILGLLGLLPLTFNAIAAIALGVALLLGGAALARRYSRLVPAAAASRGRQEIAGALGLQAIAGVAAIVLGILALLRIDPLMLLGVTAIVLGAALVAAGGGMARLARSARWLRGEGDSVYAASGWEALVGIGAVELGIMALTGHAPLTLTLVAMLCVGAAILVGGTVLASRLFGVFG